MEYWLAMAIYMMGSLFIVVHLEPAEGSSNVKYLILVFLWPAITVYTALMDALGFTEEED